MECKKCKQNKPISCFKTYRKRNGELSYRGICRNCYNENFYNYKSTISNTKNRVRGKYTYIDLDTANLQLISNGKRKYWCCNTGIIYVQTKQGFREVTKILNTRGYVEFKMHGKSYNYKREVAKAFVPNNCNGNFVVSLNGNTHDMRPCNLKWIWTRHNKAYTPSEALSKCNDHYLIQYYTSGDTKALNRGINNVIESMYSNMQPDLLGELYLIIHSYAQRNLLFDLKKDIIGTYIGLVRQQNRVKNKTISLNTFTDKNKELACYG